MKITPEVYTTPIYQKSFLSKGYTPLDDVQGFIKNKSQVSLFRAKDIPKYIDKYKKIKVFGLTPEEYKTVKLNYGIKSPAKAHVTLLKFNKDIMDLPGKKYKNHRYYRNKYSTRVEITDMPKSDSDFDQFIEEWKEVRKDAHRTMLAGYDKNFYENHLIENRENLISKFFYLEGKLEGYFICERVNDVLYNQIFRKANTSYDHLCLFIDIVNFQTIYEQVEKPFIVNMEGDIGKKGLRNYKTENFDVFEIIDIYEPTIVGQTKSDTTKNKPVAKKVKEIKTTTITIRDIDALTPVEKHDGIYFKRDDLYLPYDDYQTLGGSKVRQMQCLFEEIKNEFPDKYKGLITFCQVVSPQSLIVAKIAKENRLPCIICVGATTAEKAIENHIPIRLAHELGAEIRNVSGVGYNAPLRAKSREIAEELNYYLVEFGINLQDNEGAYMRAIANQVKNIPDDLHRLIVPAGSGITLAGILIGLKKFNKEVTQVVGIQISGYDREGDIDKILKRFNVDQKYELVIDKTYPYSDNIICDPSPELQLNYKYEAKAYDYFKRHRERFQPRNSSKVLFWVIGNNNILYRPRKGEKDRSKLLYANEPIGKRWEREDFSNKPIYTTVPKFPDYLNILIEEVGKMSEKQRRSFSEGVRNHFLSLWNKGITAFSGSHDEDAIIKNWEKLNKLEPISCLHRPIKPLIPAPEDEKMFFKGDILKTRSVDSLMLVHWFPEMYDVKFSWGKNLPNQYKDSEEFYKIINKLFVKDAFNIVGNNSKERIYKKLVAGSRTVNAHKPICNFPTNVAKFIYLDVAQRMVTSKSTDFWIYDQSGGWGARELAALSACSDPLLENLMVHYYNTDPNSSTHDRFEMIYSYWHEHINKQLKFDLYKSLTPAEEIFNDSVFAELEGKFDMAFTSPPYFSCEKYVEEDTQSYIRYPRYNGTGLKSWKWGFLYRMIQNTHRLLKPGGEMWLNIADVKTNDKSYYPLQADAIELAESVGFKLVKTYAMTFKKMQGLKLTKNILKHEGTEKRFEPIYVFKKGK